MNSNELYSKKIITYWITFAILLFSATNIFAKDNSSKEVIVAGCKTAYFVMKDIVKDFKEFSTLTLNPKRVGNKVAAKLLVAEDIKFAFTCKPHESLAKKFKLDQNKVKSWKNTPFAKDPVVVLLNNKNPINDLTLKQLKDIFTGKITNWKDAGGQDAEIKITYQTDALSSGVLVVFREAVFGDDHKKIKLAESAVRFEGPKKRGAYVAQNSNAITFMGLSAYQKRYGKLLKINGVAPTKKSIVTGAYPISVTYYVVYDKKRSSDALKFLEFLKTDNGKNALDRNFVAMPK